MSKRPAGHIAYKTVELEGVTYAILLERRLLELCRRAGVEPPGCPAVSREEAVADGMDLDGARLARRLILRRKRAGLTQSELARRADVRVETLNRVERGRTTPDFSTVRKLLIAINQAEADLESDMLGGPVDSKE